MIKAIVFDLAGTLVYGEEDTATEDKDEVFSRIMRENGYDVYYQEFKAARHLVFFVDYPRRRANTPEEFYAKVMERLEIPADLRVAAELAQKSAELERMKLFDDVVSTINALKARGIKTAILTTIPLWMFQHVFEANHVKIDFICTAREAKAVKPNPKIYKCVLNTLQVKPEEALMVGDTPEIDITTPKKLGMKAVMLCRDEVREVKQADHIIHSLTELLNIIQETV